MTLALAVAAAAGTVRGTTGFGGPAIMMLALTQLYTPVSVLGLVLIADYVANVQLAVGALRFAAWRLLRTLLLGTLIGMPFGIYALETVDPLWIKKSIALVTGVSTLLMLTGWRFRGVPASSTVLAAGLLGGAVVGATFIALPIMIFIFSQPSDAATSRANALVWGLVASSALIVALWTRGLLDLSQFAQVLAVTAAYMAGAAIGSRVFKTLSEQTFRRLVLAALLGLSLLGLVG